MSARLTIKDLEKLQKDGKIRDYSAPAPVSKKVKGLKKDKGSKNKGWIALQLKYWCEAEGLILSTEFHFHPRKKWRFDWAITNQERTIMIGIEYEGLFSEKSGHTTVGGYNKDTEKYNAANSLGWKLVRVTAINHKRLFYFINEVINAKDT